MSKYGLFAKFIAKDGELDTLVSILLEAAHAMENLENCEVYHVSVSATEPNTVFVYEIWKDENAHKASLLFEETKILIQRAKPIIQGIERISSFIPKGGKL